MGTDARTMRLSANGQDLYELILERIDGRPMRLARFWGQVLLVVNLASLSPRAAQLQSLEALHQRYGELGLRVLGFPCDDFGNSEPSHNAALQLHYEAELGLSFPLFTKVRIDSGPRHSLFEMLARARTEFLGGGDVTENFEKFLVSRDGRLLRWFDADVPPDAPQLLTAIEQALRLSRDDRCSLLPTHSVEPLSTGPKTFLSCLVRQADVAPAADTVVRAAAASNLLCPK